MTKTAIILQATVVLLLAFACSKRKSELENLINEDTFVNLYVEVAIVREAQLGEENLKGIFARYNLTPEKFHTVVKFYQSNPQKWIGLYQKIVRKLTAVRDQKIKGGETEISRKPKSEPPP